MRKKIDVEIKAGLFVFFGLLLIMVTILLMGGTDSLFEKNFRLNVIMPDANGLAKGTIVRSGGLKIGRVDTITFSENYENVKVTMLIQEAFRKRMHADSLVRQQTQGVLGDKFFDITPGSPDKPVLSDNATIEVEASKDLSSMLAEGEGAMQLLKENLVNLRSITAEVSAHNHLQHIMKDMAETTGNLKSVSEQLKNGAAINELNQTMKNIRVVSEKVKNGEGTIGALFSDASLYEDLKHLIGGANRNNVLKFFVRQAVKSSDDQELQQEKKSAAPKKP